MSRLAREELRHFEQVRAVMAEWGIAFERLSASRYAGSLRDVVRRQEPERLLDLLLVGALIEARSCERFAALVPVLPKAMSRFYAGLLASEARHFDHYLQFARTESGVDSRVLDRRLDELRDLEAQLITADDTVFRFHSGMPNPPAIETES
jgi:tRNA-(ms[2]io[6]A)-hydroxylase